MYNTPFAARSFSRTLHFANQSNRTIPADNRCEDMQAQQGSCVNIASNIAPSAWNPGGSARSQSLTAREVCFLVKRPVEVTLLERLVVAGPRIRRRFPLWHKRLQASARTIGCVRDGFSGIHHDRKLLMTGCISCYKAARSEAAVRAPVEGVQASAERDHRIGAVRLPQTVD